MIPNNYNKSIGLPDADAALEPVIPDQHDNEEFGSLNIQSSDNLGSNTTLWFNNNCFSLTLAVQASGIYTNKTNTLAISPGTLFFTRPSIHRQLQWHNLDEVYHITFSERFLIKYAGVEFFKTFPFLLLETIVPKEENSEIFEELRNIYLQIEKIEHSNIAFKKNIVANLTTRLLLRIKQNFWEDYQASVPQNKENDILKQFIRNLEHHFMLLQQGKICVQLRVNDYAKMQGIHSNYLSNVIKERSGKMVSSWIAEKTVLLAENLLGGTSLSIKEISYRLGFTYISYFTMFFKKHTGLTPKAFREAKNYNSNYASMNLV